MLLKFLGSAIWLAIVFAFVSAHAGDALLTPGNILDGKSVEMNSAGYAGVRNELPRFIEITKLGSLPADKLIIRMVDRRRHIDETKTLTFGEVQSLNPFLRRAASAGDIALIGVAEFGVATRVVGWVSDRLITKAVEMGITRIAYREATFRNPILTELGFNLMLGFDIIGSSGIVGAIVSAIDVTDPGHQWERARIEKEMISTLNGRKRGRVLIAVRSPKRDETDEFDDYKKHIDDIVHDLNR
jgi:hypothetical protein